MLENQPGIPLVLSKRQKLPQEVKIETKNNRQSLLFPFSIFNL